MKKEPFSAEKLVEFSQLASRAANLGGKYLLDYLGKVEVCEKAPGDLVTNADLESQRAIRKLIADEHPDHFFLGEENDGAQDSLPESEHLCWIVDPLDGTTNYAHQLPSFSVSVALLYRATDGTEEILVGAVFDPVLDECFTAIKGHGAQLNGRSIVVGDCQSLRKSLLVVSLSSHLTATDPQLTRFMRVIENAGSFRRLGSAALNFCYIACGRLDGYWATSIKIWDVAAGVLILKEAGGIITDIDGSAFDFRAPKFVATCTKELYQQLQPLLDLEDR